MKHELLLGDVIEVLRTLPNESVNCCVTSPPYWGLRDYGIKGQLGLEQTPEEYVTKIVAVFREIKRVLRKDGTVWLNLGDSYAHPNTGGNGATGGRGKSTLQSSMPPINTTPTKKYMPKSLKPKDLIGIPWRVAFTLQEDGWWLRSEIIWEKPNCLPESVTDRPTKSHEYIFLLTKNKKYYYNHEAIKEPCVNGDHTSPRGSKGVRGNLNAGLRKQDAVGKRQYTGFNDRYEPLEKRNKRSVWTISTQPYKAAHFATFPEKLIEPCILAGCAENGTVLDPFGGSGTVSRVCEKLGRNSIYIDLNPEYLEMAKNRIREVES